jgi:hypothetical protein
MSRTRVDRTRGRVALTSSQRHAETEDGLRTCPSCFTEHEEFQLGEQVTGDSFEEICPDCGFHYGGGAYAPSKFNEVRRFE